MVLASGLARAPAPMPAALSHRRLLIPATGAAAAAGALRNGLTACRSRAPRLPWPSTGGAGAGPVRKNLRNITVRAQAAAAADNGDSGSGGGSTGKPLPAPLAKLAALFRPLSDERCNSKLLALAVGQMLCSIATLIHDSYLPLYVHEELGIGAVQGAAQFLCQLSKGVSGVVGDILGSQTRVLVFGTLLTFACKPMFALLSSVYGVFGVTACLYWFFVAKLLDRLSKGIREAPTKAVMNELAKESGDAPDAAYGLRQSLATAGMLIGSTVAAVTFAATGSNYILTFAVAAVPPGLALAWLVTNFREELFGPPHSPPLPPPVQSSTIGSISIDLPPASAAPSAMGSMDSAAAGAAAAAAAGGGGFTPGAAPPSLIQAAEAAAAAAEPKLSWWEKGVAIVKSFQPAYWQALAVVAVLYFARFDASFLSLRAKAVMPKSLLPMLTLVNMLAQTILTAPLARISGASVSNRNRLLLAGFACMVAADLLFALPATASPAGMFGGAAFIGLHMAMTHAITISMISSYMPTGVIPGVGRLSGTAVSFTDLLLGFVLAASNAVAGILADLTRAAGYGNVGCFLGGAAACVLSGLLLLAFERWGDLGKPELVVARTRKAKAA
ncbi:hypothetical protein CHLRE_05g232751v5 [Chlamydomonas reinhardtii]|uniref:Major facilitator superfamily (MFS) profile domain-containing protein n=1 Tax=Chlamydomonas reinhardtii TaxID=3055 RepID=A0A2K3DRV6_CHLRE|nr:uncharacterized protein CHLRE_05g232751v5 [Chlamydomonas reinhardtii]PNW83272.1 hypothetical protein CHLRE_05g232751v5 [Chlamydomonas reinhardtii]